MVGQPVSGHRVGPKYRHCVSHHCKTFLTSPRGTRKGFILRNPLAVCLLDLGPHAWRLHAGRSRKVLEHRQRGKPEAFEQDAVGRGEDPGHVG
ncbi:hypothetical protein P3W24_18300, partial [Luteibacter sp. PPL201]